MLTGNRVPPLSMLNDKTHLTVVSGRHFCAQVGLESNLVYTYFDEGSSSTMVSKGLAEALGLKVDKGGAGGFRTADH